MPATEQTWRDGKLLHKVFGVTSLLLLIATIWMFAKDHDREWKQYQDTARKVDIINTEWRTLQYDTEAWHREHEALQERVRQTQAQGIDPKLIQAFILEVENAGDAGLPVRDLTRLNAMNDSLNVAVSEARDVRNGRDADDENEAITSYNERKLAAERARVQLDEARQQIEQAGKKVDEAAEAKIAELEEALDATEEELQLAEKEVMDAEASVIRQRKLLLSEMDNIVAFAKYEESDRLKTRKFESANLDKAKADLDIAIRDNKDADTMASRQAIVDELKARIDQMTLDYQAASDHRNRLQQIASQARADEDDLSKQLADNGAELDRLRRAIADRETAFFDFYGPIPLPGKRWLEMPILDAFNSPRKVQNLWSDGLEQNYNFKNVRRFDRCTTCHQAMEKTLPGTADKPAYVDESLVTFVIDPESADEDGKASNVGEILGLAIDNFLGVGLEDRGLLDHDDVTISFIVPDSLAAKARQKPEVSGDTSLTATQLRESLFNPNINAFSAVTASSEVGVPGLLVGDVIERIDGDPIRGRDRAIFRLQELERQGKPFEITVRRGLPEPFVSHPRLDLYVGSLSPHKVADFACTICHEGQGSATDFKWASHTPNDERQKKEWAEKYGWFDNHHWIYPMSPQRFIESTCLKCHHDVVELEPSERFPEPPAPTLTHGYNVIRKYGCYGCHEVNGYDGPDKRIGPDMRLEPQFYAAALEIANNPQSGFDNLSDEGQSLVRDLIENPENQIARHKLYQIVLEDKLADEPKLSADIHKRIAPLLKDVEVPGSLAKPGPSLRFVTDKLDDAFLYDWIREPKHFRPSTRMPQFFGLWNHLEGESKAKAQEYEPIEILGLVSYLKDRSQPFEQIQPASGISESTPEEMVDRGKILFQERGCLACHTHKDFPDATAQREAREIVQGPDLSGVADKFDPQRNSEGPAWLYTWIKRPTDYHSRTVMPDLILEPIQHRDAAGEVTMTTDPVADIVAYLMANSSVGWTPQDPVLELTAKQREALNALTLEHLTDAFYVKTAEDYLKKGIPSSRSAGLKAAELDLLVDDTDYDSGAELSDERKLIYVGKKTIAKYGCYGCHDIPGFEDAKPIGTGLADWGRKDPAKLAFEHVTHYLHHMDEHHGDGHASDSHGHETDGDGHAHADDDVHGPLVSHDAGDDVPLLEKEPATPPFFEHQLMAGNRIGFLYQKLREPRSYDYEKTKNKRYNERLRMPQFPFDDAEREAVMTFVLGLVAEPPSPKYVYSPSEREEALIKGRIVLEKYNCGGCHVLDAERWDIAYSPDYFGPQRMNPTYPFVAPQFSLEQLTNSLVTNRQGNVHATLRGLPGIGDDGLPIVNDEEGDSVTASGDDATFDPATVEYSFSLLQPTVLDGTVYQVSEQAITVPAAQVDNRYETNGGFLAKYLLPHVVAREKLVNPNAKGSEAWGWLPPPLVGQGNKVQAEWLYQFLLDPHLIRPAVVLRMPKFNLSTDEATALVNYFAAKDNADYPYEYSERRRADRLAAADAAYRERSADGAADEDSQRRRLDDAMKIIVNNNYCVKCHIVGDFEPVGSDRAKAPNLAIIHQRMRADYLRQWIAKPTSILPYTSMPVNIPYDPNAENLGGISQELYHGTSVEQLDGLVDLLMNYDEYAKQQANVSALVEAAKPSENPAGAEPTAEAAGASDPANQPPATDTETATEPKPDAESNEAADSAAKSPENGGDTDSESQPDETNKDSAAPETTTPANEDSTESGS